MKRSKTLPLAFRLTLPVMFGYLCMGCAFGIIIQTGGYNFIWAFVISLTCYSGSMQFVLAELLATAAPVVTVAVMTLAVQIRHIFYGLSLVDAYKKSGRKRFYMIFALTDETYSLQCSLEVPDGVNEGTLRFLISLLDQIYWIAGCTVGALLGQLIPFDFEGADFAMTALFVVILVEQWQSAKSHLPALVGAGCAIVSLLVFGPDNFIFPALIASAFVLLILRNQLDPLRKGKEVSACGTSGNS